MTSNTLFNNIPENQRKSFKPTFLYIKQCKITGTLYFGKTTNSNPVTYRGSGTHWRLIYKKYGRENIETIWYCLYTDIDILYDFAVKFSAQESIVDSPNWANLKEENGLDGGGDWDEEKRKTMSERKRYISDETREKMSVAAKNRPKISEETRKILSSVTLGRKPSAETKKKMSDAAKLIKKDKTWCQNLAISNSRNYIVTDPNGIAHEVNHLKSFCKEKDLNYNALIAKARFNKYEENGWNCKYADSKNHKERIYNEDGTWTWCFKK